MDVYDSLQVKVSKMKETAKLKEIRNYPMFAVESIYGTSVAGIYPANNKNTILERETVQSQ